MTQDELWNGIGLPVEARGAAATALSQQETGEWKKSFEMDEDEFYRRIGSRENADALVLALYGRWALETWERYVELGIPENIFIDTFRDLALWSRQCRQQKGHWGLMEWQWNALALKLEIFRLGRLQYQPRKLPHPVVLPDREYPEGTQALEVHIPEGGPLLPEQIRASLEAAPPFFQQYFQKDYRIFHCHSWLLAPELTELLPGKSNILAFRALFQVYRTDYGFRQAEERVFGGIRDDIPAYPAQTDLQKKLKTYLLSGGCVGMGAGVILIPCQFQS